MLDIDQALSQLLEASGRQEVVHVAHGAARDHVLAAPVVSDLDSPPFAKALMDGFAVRSEDLAAGIRELRVTESVSAGDTPKRDIGRGEATRIMTGAPIPVGADAVVMVEETVPGDGDTVIIERPLVDVGQNIMPRGREMKRGENVLEAGQRLGPVEIGLLASVGHTQPAVYRRPTVSVLSTGDELVAPQSKPGPSQIRNSNAALLTALAETAGAQVRDLGIVGDCAQDIAKRVEAGLSSDILLLSGGVSAGRKDLVPGVLAAAGVERIFHKVAIKPGKPVWFGRHEGGLVFGLPGNPVSVLACFELFVCTALRQRQAQTDPMPRYLPAALKNELKSSSSRTIFHPARLSASDHGLEVEPVPWFGSADLKAVHGADALLVIPSGEISCARGSIMNTLPIQGRY
jgi:molybdopterin molybdotransferase